VHHVIAIGASAGGLDALRRFFQSADRREEVSYLVAQHLSPDHKSLMPELLARHTDVEMHAAEHGAPIEPGHAYLLPPGFDMRVQEGILALSPRARDGSLHLPIDTLFASLAEDRGSRSAAVVLSGLGSDGVDGLRAIKAVGGLVGAQDPGTAQFDGMPGNAIATGLVDLVEAPEALLPGLLKALEHRPQLTTATEDGAPSHEADPKALERILWAVAQHSQLDFSAYKTSTLTRRIERRMRVRQIDSLQSYAELLVDDGSEARQLQREFLINVTRFFRDTAVFEHLRRDLVPALVRQARQNGREIRVWSVGCSTGEEAYSLALLFREQIDRHRSGEELSVKIFASDVDSEAIEQASPGVFSGTVVSEAPPDLVERYFVRRDETFTIHRSVRDLVVFARHNALEDPPLTRMDVVLCRNLLIYLEPEAQQHILRRLSFALHPGGTLILGSSETVGEMVDRFEIVDRRLRIYRSRGRALPLGVDYRRSAIGTRHGGTRTAPRRDHWADAAVDRAHAQLFESYVPPALLVDDQGRLLHVFPSSAGAFKLSAGPATLELASVLPRSAASTVSAAIHRAADIGDEVLVPGVKMWPEGTVRSADIRVRPLADPSGHTTRLLLLFERPLHLAVPAEGNEPNVAELDEVAQERIRFLEENLARTQERLQSTIEELESSNEELQATNEELLSANEELQSTNEELQSVNEELHTVNSEYQNKIRELSELNADMDNLFESTAIGTVFLDPELRVRRFTSAAAGFLPLLPRDVDRPVAHFGRSLPGIDLLALCRRVLEEETSLEREVAFEDGRRVLLRMSVFTDATQEPGGVVLNFVDISALRAAERGLSDVLDGLPEHIAVLDPNRIITYVNESWKRFAIANGATEADADGVGADYIAASRGAYGPGDDTAARAAEGVQQVLDGKLSSFVLEYPCHSPTEERWYVMRVASLSRGGEGAVVSHQDVTLRRLAERAGAAKGALGRAAR
jgi:two-component system, chemotaxis family, CheB/CheR fusion protein